MNINQNISPREKSNIFIGIAEKLNTDFVLIAIGTTGPWYESADKRRLGEETTYLAWPSMTNIVIGEQLPSRPLPCCLPDSGATSTSAAQ